MARKPKFKCDLGASFALAFKNWRRKSKLPLKQVARDLGVFVNTVSLWELGQRFPSKRHFEMLADYTRQPPCKLFCIVADKCIPADCLLAMTQINPAQE